MTRVRKKCQTLLMLGCLLLTGILNSCGYFSDESIENQDLYTSDDLNATCELKPDALGRIFQDNIETQIRCLENNFNKFIQYVRRENRDYVNEDEIGTFVRRFFHENSEAIINGLKILFQLNMIVLDDERDRISTDNVGPLFKLLKSSNREVVTITKTLAELEKTNYWSKRAVLQKAIERFSETTLSIINEGQEEPKTLNLRKFFNDLSKRFEGINLNEETINSITFMKHLFIGGEPEEITTWEIKKLVHKAPKLVMLGLDFYYVSDEHFPKKQGWEIFEFYKERLVELEEVLHPNYTQDRVFSNSDLVDVVKSFLGNDNQDIEKYKKLIYSFKRNLIRGDDEYYSYTDMKLGLNYAKILMESISSVEEFYWLTKGIDEQRGKVKRDLIAADLKSRAKIRSKNISDVLNKDLFPEEIQLKEFLKDAVELFDSKQMVKRVGFEFTPHFIDAAFSAKVAFLGGNKEVTTFPQIQKLFELYPDLIKDAFKLIFYKGEDFQSEDQLYYHYSELVARVKDLYLLERDNPDRIIMQTRDILTLAKEIVSGQDIDLDKFAPTMRYLKKNWIGGNADEYSERNITQLLDLGHTLLKRTYFFGITYSGHKGLMDKNTKIHDVPRLELEEYEHFTKQELRNFHQDFRYTAKNFRHFRKENGYNYYGNDIKRYKQGFLETSMIHWASNYLIDVFDKNGSNGLDENEVDFTLKTFKPVLQAFDLWTTDITSFAQNAMLLSDLFQSTSNGTLEVDQDEFTEFGSLVLMSMKTAGEVVDELKRIADGESELNITRAANCHYKDPDEPVFPVECYREYFYKIIFEKLDMQDELPRLHDYVQNTSRRNLKKYLRDIEGFARDVSSRPNDPIGYSEISKVFGAMLNIEATFMRFDHNENNVVSTEDIVETIRTPQRGPRGRGPRTVKKIDELDKAFGLYKDAIITVAGLDGWIGNMLSETIFLYMLKYQEIPSTGDALWFYFKHPFVDVKAKRSNIGSLLFFMVNQQEMEGPSPEVKDLKEGIQEQKEKFLDDAETKKTRKKKERVGPGPVGYAL